MALYQVGVLILLTTTGLLVATFESGPVSLIVGLSAAVLGAGAALWSWLAVRWVDQNSKWG